jgi:hypothetical protein
MKHLPPPHLARKAPRKAPPDLRIIHRAPANDNRPPGGPGLPASLRLSASEEKLAEELVNSFMAKILGVRGG